MENKEMAMDDVAATGFLDPAREALARFGKMKINVAQAERWGSAAIGGGLVLYGLKRRSWSGLLFAVAGGGLMLRGIMGRSVFYRMVGINTATGQGLPGQDFSNGLIRVDKSLVIARSPEDMFRFLRAIENLPRFLGHLRTVRVVDGHRSVWTAKMPAGLELEWEAEIWEERENRKIVWRTTGETGLRSEGSLILDPLGDGTRTQVGVHLEYHLPAGKVGKAFARLFGKHPDRLIDEELHRLKSLMESGA